MFFHGRNGCSSGDSCKYSHEPLTDETREILEKVGISDIVFMILWDLGF